MSEGIEVLIGGILSVFWMVTAGVLHKLRGVTATKLGQAEQQVRSLDDEVDTLRARLETTERSNRGLREQARYEAERRKNAEKELAEAKEGIAIRDQADKRLINELIATEQERDALAAAVKRLAQQVDESAERLSAVSQERDAWLTEANNLQEALDAANAHLAELSKEAADLKERNDRQAAVILNHTDAASASDRYRDTLCAQLASAHDENAVLASRATAAEDELNERARTIDRLAVELRSLREERDRLGRMAGAALGMGTINPIGEGVSILDAVNWRDSHRRN